MRFLYAADGGSVLQVGYPGTASDADRRRFTLSCWVRNLAGDDGTGAAIFALTGDFSAISLAAITGLQVSYAAGGLDGAIYSGIPNDVWSHFVFQLDTSQAVEADRLKVFKDNAEIFPLDPVVMTQNRLSAFFLSGAALSLGALFPIAGKLAFVDICPGNIYAPSSFAADVSGVWSARMAPSVSYGTLGSRYDGSDGFNDTSGNGLHLTDIGNPDPTVALDFADLPPYA
ncbi:MULTISPECIES: hypothetical protein [Rhodomicrobium]|uniref:hypothetical protein n=1 Tax=Rhodomicrobium TaxID=1068 RepID=UPI000F747D96|nr:MULTISPECIES: hypothetical protein [Rhodomicrobium]